MSMFGDYKSYRKYEPTYYDWKNKRDLLDAKRLAYVEKHPEIINNDDIQRGRVLLRAIDIMDEYSQKKAENMEAATEPAISMGLELVSAACAGIGALLGLIKPIGKFFASFVPKGNKNKKMIGVLIPTALGLIAGSFAAFPLMAWGAKAEVGASRKGRFEAMRKELDNPKGFAILSDEQVKEVKEKAKKVVLDEDKKKNVAEKISNSFSSLKEMATDSKEYREQRRKFLEELAEDEKNIDRDYTEKEIENAKKDQQLLTKLVEKIDIASQDYAENSELATQTGILLVGSFGGLIYAGAKKVLKTLKVQSANKIAFILKALSIAAFAGMGIIAAQINKQASRVGRFKVKQEIMKNPNNFVYVSDEQAETIKDAEVVHKKKDNIFKFLIKAIKNNKEFDKYKKTEGKDERRFYKAAESIELSSEQLNDAKRLQKNAFRTFNKVDENSQKFAESIEALGQSVAYPINTLFGIGAAAVGTPYLIKEAKTEAERHSNIMKYIGIVILSTIPAMLINAYITKEQKKASKIADMKAINELNDVRKFA